MAKGKSNSKSGKVKRSPMTKAAAIRIQRAAAKAGDGGVEKGSFAAKAMSWADKRSSE